MVAAAALVIAVPTAAAATPGLGVVALDGAGPSALSLAPAPGGAPAELVTAAPAGGAGPVQLFSINTGVSPAAVQASNSGQLGSADAAALSPALIVNDGALDWVWSDGTLYSIDSAGAVGSSGVQVDGGVGLVTDPYGDLYTSDDAGHLAECVVSGASPDCQVNTAAEQAGALDAPGPDAIAYAGGLIWAETRGGSLYSVAAATSASAFADNPLSGGVDPGQFTGDPGTALAPDGANLFAGGLANPGSGATGSVGGFDSVLYELNASSGAVEGSATIPSAGSSTPKVDSLTIGPDGNLWFLDTNANAIGELNITDGGVTEYPLPDGAEFANPPLTLSDNQIADGPAGSDMLFATAQNSAGDPVVVEVALQGTATVVSGPPRLTIGPTASVSTRHVVSLALRCDDDVCTGSVSLTVSIRTAGAKRATVLKLGSIRYALNLGSSTVLSLKLSARDYALLEKAAGHRLKAKVTIRPHSGRTSIADVTLQGSALRKK